MPLTVVNIKNNGHIEFEDNTGTIVGIGRAYPSNSKPGYVTLTMSSQVSDQLAKGIPLRVPINWLNVTPNERST